MKLNSTFKIILVAVIWITSMVNSVHGFGVIAVKAPVSGSVPVDRADVLARDADLDSVSLINDYCGILRWQKVDVNQAQQVKEALVNIQTSCYNKWVAKGIVLIESTFRCWAKNPSSSASGCAQFLDSTWSSRCWGSKHNIYDQMQCVVRMVEQGSLATDWMPYWDAEAKARFYTFLRGSI